MKHKILFLIQEYKETKIIEGSAFKYFVFFWSTKFFSLLQQSKSFLNKAVHQVVSFLPKPTFTIQNKSGIFVVQAFDDSTTICSNYFEQQLRDWLTTPEKKDIFIDIGANRGIYTVIAPTLFGYAEVHSFEPNPEVVHILKKNVSLNHLQNKVIVHGTALGESDGILAFACDPMHLGGGQIVSDISQSTLEVKVGVFDAYVSTIPTERISFIKIDTEGFEFNVLKGMKHTLSTMSPGSCLMIESTEHEEIKDFLLEYGFTLVDSKNHDHLFKKHA